MVIPGAKKLLTIKPLVSTSTVDGLADNAAHPEIMGHQLFPPS